MNFWLLVNAMEKTHIYPPGFIQCHKKAKVTVARKCRAIYFRRDLNSNEWRFFFQTDCVLFIYFNGS